MFDLKKHFYTQFFEKKHGKILKISRYAGGGGGLEIFKNFAASAAARLHLFLIGGGGSEIFKTFAVSAAAAVFFWEKSAAAQPIGLHL